jgi:hypothetical protein
MAGAARLVGSENSDVRALKHGRNRAEPGQPCPSRHTPMVGCYEAFLTVQPSMPIQAPEKSRLPPSWS